MEAVSEPKKKMKSGIFSMVIEIVVILILTIVLLTSLHFLKILDISSLFLTSTPKVEKQAVKQGNTSKPAGPTSTLNDVQISKFQRNLFIIQKNKAMHIAFSVFEFEGTIKNIDTKPGYDETTNSGYNIRLILSVGDGKEEVTMVYPEQAKDKIKILDSAKKKIEVTELKIGDKVTINTNLATLRQYPNNFNSVTITKE